MGERVVLWGPGPGKVVQNPAPVEATLWSNAPASAAGRGAVWESYVVTSGRASPCTKRRPRPDCCMRMLGCGYCAASALAASYARRSARILAVRSQDELTRARSPSGVVASSRYQSPSSEQVVSGLVA